MWCRKLSHTHPSTSFSGIIALTTASVLMGFSESKGSCTMNPCMVWSSFKDVMYFNTWKQYHVQSVCHIEIQGGDTLSKSKGRLSPKSLIVIISKCTSSWILREFYFTTEYNHQGFGKKPIKELRISTIITTHHGLNQDFCDNRNVLHFTIYNTIVVTEYLKCG